MNRSMTFRRLVSVVTLLLLVLSGAGSIVQRASAATDPNLTNKVQQAVVSYLGYQPTTSIIVANIQQTALWASGTVAIAAAPTEGAAPTAYLFLAQHLNSGWEVALEPTPQFQTWLRKAPDSVVSPEVRAVLLTNPSLAGDGSGNLSLSYPTGETWTLTGGPHIAVPGRETARNAVDFSGGSGEIRAAGDGIAYYSSSCPNYISIAHGGGWKTTYYHAVNIAVGYGQVVSRGQFLGNISAQAGCGGSATGPHVHFATYLNGVDHAMNGVDIGGWTVENGVNEYEGCMLRIRDGWRQCVQGQISNDGSIGSGTPPNQPPNKPSLVSPAAGTALGSSTSVTLAWSDNGDPDNAPNAYRNYTLHG